MIRTRLFREPRRGRAPSAVRPPRRRPPTQSATIARPNGRIGRPCSRPSRTELGLDVPHDNKNSGQTLTQPPRRAWQPRGGRRLLRRDDRHQGRRRGRGRALHARRLRRDPDGLKDPEGRWFTIHQGTLGLFVNVDALGGAPVPACFEDLLDPGVSRHGRLSRPLLRLRRLRRRGGGEPGLSAATCRTSIPRSTISPASPRTTPSFPSRLSYGRVVSGEIPILFDYDFQRPTAKLHEEGTSSRSSPARLSVGRALRD